MSAKPAPDGPIQFVAAAPILKEIDFLTTEVRRLRRELELLRAQIGIRGTAVSLPPAKARRAKR